jgi:hypothetical protein
MKYPSSIPLWHTNGEPLPESALCRVVLSSAGAKWNDVVVEQQNYPSNELVDVMFKRHVIAINVGDSLTCEFKKEGRFQRVLRARSSISFFPSDQPFSSRLKVETGAFANVLFLALNPLFVTHVAERLEFDVDRIELVEQRRGTDPTLRYIAMALRAGIRTGDALDRMYGEALSTAVAVHLLREYALIRPTPILHCYLVYRKSPSFTLLKSFISVCLELGKDFNMVIRPRIAATETRSSGHS